MSLLRVKSGWMGFTIKTFASHLPPKAIYNVVNGEPRAIRCCRHSQRKRLAFRLKHPKISIPLDFFKLPITGYLSSHHNRWIEVFVIGWVDVRIAIGIRGCNRLCSFKTVFLYTPARQKYLCPSLKKETVPVANMANYASLCAFTSIQ